MHLTIILLLFVAAAQAGEKCESNGVQLECPSTNDPTYFTKCCLNNRTKTFFCCEKLYQPDPENAVMWMSILVIVTCFAVSALIIVCCFWSRCPLFYTFRVKTVHTGAIVYAENNEESSNLPTDIDDHSRQYSPMHVRILQQREQ